MMIGQHIGNYQVVRKLGQGGMGTVYEAVHTQIGRQAAIKILRPDLSAQPETARRFLNEARAVNLVHHPAVVSIFEFGSLDSGAAYIVMELLRGTNLRDRLRLCGGRLAVPEVLHLARQMASALSAVHAQGIVHRDLKPANVMIVSDPEMVGGERVKIVDFGVAKMVVDLDDPLTQAGAMMGTPTYMAPEQCRDAGAVDAKADVYSLGTVLYQCIAGRPPFATSDMASTIAAQLLTEPPPLLQVAPAGVPAALAALLHSMLAKDPTQRPTMSQVATAMERLGAPRESLAPMRASHPALVAVMATGPMSQPSTLAQAASQLRAKPLLTGRRGLAALVLLTILVVLLTAGLSRRTVTPAAAPPPVAAARPAAEPPRVAPPPAAEVAPPRPVAAKKIVKRSAPPRRDRATASPASSREKDYEAKSVE